MEDAILKTAPPIIGEKWLQYNLVPKGYPIQPPVSPLQHETLTMHHREFTGFEISEQQPLGFQVGLPVRVKNLLGLQLAYCNGLIGDIVAVEHPADGSNDLLYEVRCIMNLEQEPNLIPDPNRSRVSLQAVMAASANASRFPEGYDFQPMMLLSKLKLENLEALAEIDHDKIITSTSCEPPVVWEQPDNDVHPQAYPPKQLRPPPVWPRKKVIEEAMSWVPWVP